MKKFILVFGVPAAVYFFVDQVLGAAIALVTITLFTNLYDWFEMRLNKLFGIKPESQRQLVVLDKVEPGEMYAGDDKYLKG